MKINYKVFSKHAEKVAKGVGETRPILKGIEHREDGTLTVTDSHRLYRAYNVNAPKNVVLDAVTGEEIDAGTYPDADRLLPTSSPRRTYGIRDLKTVKATLKAMEQVAKSQGKKKGQAYVVIEDERIRLQNDTDFEIDVSYPLLPVEGTEEIKVVASLQYVLEAIEMYDDMSKGTADVVIRLHGCMRPFTIDVAHEESITALVMPVREY